MPLTAGTRLGPYEIVSAIGAGGMGEVYRATDSNLKRGASTKRDIVRVPLTGDGDALKAGVPEPHGPAGFSWRERRCSSCRTRWRERPSFPAP